MDFITAYSLFKLLAKPKSLSLQTPFFNRILAGFKSLWIIPFLCRYLAPFMMSFRKDLAQCQGSFFLSCKNLYRSPFWQNYVTIYMLLVVWQISQSLTMFQCETFLRMSISDWMFLTLQAFENIFLSITLTATGYKVSIYRPRQTMAYEPCPRSFFRLN